MSMEIDFESRFDDLIDRLGKTIKIESSSQDCENCIYDKVRKQSSNIYNTNNPNELGSEYNRPFTNGQTCPVCSSKGEIAIYTSVQGLVDWDSSDNVHFHNVSLSSKRCTIKLHYQYHKMVNSTTNIIVPIVHDRWVKCKRVGSTNPFGGGKYFSFVVEAIA